MSYLFVLRRVDLDLRGFVPRAMRSPFGPVIAPTPVLRFVPTLVGWRGLDRVRTGRVGEIRSRSVGLRVVRVRPGVVIAPTPVRRFLPPTFLN